MIQCDGAFAQGVGYTGYYNTYTIVMDSSISQEDYSNFYFYMIFKEPNPFYPDLINGTEPLPAEMIFTNGNSVSYSLLGGSLFAVYYYNFNGNKISIQPEFEGDYPVSGVDYDTNYSFASVILPVFDSMTITIHLG